MGIGWSEGDVNFRSTLVGRKEDNFASLPCSSSRNIAFGQDGILGNQTRQGKEINEDSYDIFDETHNCLENMAEIDEAHQGSILLTIKNDELSNELKL